MSKGTKFVLIFILIAILALSIYVGKQGMNKGKENTIVTSMQNTKKNENIENNNVQNVSNNTDIENINTNEIKPEDIVDSKTLTDEDKAKELVKQKWGGSEGVYFSIDTINNDETYVVSVRESSTTKVLEWYTVDIKKGTVKN